VVADDRLGKPMMTVINVESGSENNAANCSAWHVAQLQPHAMREVI